jgi:hypothetical protein
MNSSVRNSVPAATTISLPTDFHPLTVPGLISSGVVVSGVSSSVMEDIYSEPGYLLDS